MYRAAALSLLAALMLTACGDPSGGAAPTTTAATTTTTATTTSTPEDDGENGDIGSSPAFVDAVVATPIGTDVVIAVRGHVPTPCHTPRAGTAVDVAGRTISVRVGSEAPPDAICMQVLQPFELEVDASNLEAGTWQVTVDGSVVETFVIGG